ncbi:MAG: hypothetical protein IJG38_14700 [Thermoguttaceae bacterium]|nr:hypothetical protein [Thermoguttaceae bacterium]
MKNSFTIKMSMLTLAAFLLTSTLAVAQPGPRGGGHPGPAPRSGGGGFRGGPSGPRMTPPPSRPHISAPKAAPSRPDFRAQAPKSHPGPSVRPKPPMPKPGPSHHPMPGPKPGPGYHPGPKPGPGPHHIPSGGRPSWQTRPHDHFDRIYRDVHHAFRGPHVPPPPPAPRPYWNNWGVSVALGWNSFAISTGAFTFGWWDNMYYRAPWWNYYYYRSAYPVYYWWDCPTWTRVCRFYPSYGWTNGYYYDYGQNVIIGDDSYVYINGQRVTTQYEYAQSAAELATYAMPSETVSQTNLQWLPLGTFALSTSAVNPQVSTKAAIQLAATNDGLISGSFYNRETNQTFPIQGRVDPQTQRVAFYVIGAENTVFETGMYNLTQQQTPVMIHKNGGRTTQNALLVRLTAPQQSAVNTMTSDAYLESDVALPIIDDNNADTVIHSILN